MNNVSKRNKILDKVETIKIPYLVNYIINGDVTKEEITTRLADLGENDIIEELEDQLAVFDDGEWGKAQKAATSVSTRDGLRLWDQTIKAYQAYLEAFPEGRHSIECQTKISDLDELKWHDVLASISEASLNEYKLLFPQGKYIVECDTMLSDLPWLEAKQKDTITSYTEYMTQNPGKHVVEVNQAIMAIEDDKDWRNACAADNSSAYQEYLQKHPTGEHARQAQNAINASAEHDKIINDLKRNRNAYSPIELQQLVGNHVVKWDDLRDVFDQEERKKIEEYKSPTDLPPGEPPEQLVEGPTEVYFWGTPSSGKTCAMGAILSAANLKGRFVSKQTPGNGGIYRDMLSNIFDSNGICVFPKGTPDNSIQQMIFAIRDKKGKEHLISFIDLAGELFRSMFYKMNSPSDYEDLDVLHKQTVERTETYLKNTSNKKIHFFIVPYGEVNNRWSGQNITMANYMSSTMTYLKDNNIIRKGTNGLYILVTKSDNMPVAEGDRQKEAEKYIQDNMLSFYNDAKLICKNAGIADFEIIPFSVGDVFAQKLCRFKSDNTIKVLNKLISKTRAESEGLFKFLKS